jgi:YHS domain-containing protein
MKKFVLLGAALAIAAGCGADQQKAADKPAGGQPATAQAKPYPIDWCIVSGEKLGSMGDPVVRTYQGQEVKFCCKYCIEDFEKTPALYLARIDSAAAGQLQPPAGHEHGG